MICKKQKMRLHKSIRNLRLLIRPEKIWRIKLKKIEKKQLDMHLCQRLK